MTKLKCHVCSTLVYGAGDDIDVVKCPKCCSMTPTGREKTLRSKYESYRNHLPYPRSAVGRAIGYAAGIYDQSTHLKPIDWKGIEAKIEKRFGSTSKATYVAAPTVYGRGTELAKDTRAGLMFYKVEGKKEGSGDWELIYIVFRGSRGTKPGTTTLRGNEKNPKGAGWGTTETGLSINIDWRANFSNHMQLVPSWCSSVGVHKGFYKLYCSMRETIHRTVEAYTSKSPNGRVIVTGHSLGAALATVCAHDLDCSGICEPFCFPFCSPRVGNLGFVKDFNERIAEDRASP